RVQLTKHVSEMAPAPVPSGVTVPTGRVIEAADIYRVYFHGPAYQVLGRAWRDGNRIIGELAKSLPPNHVPVEQPTAMAPRLIELCFQTAGLWELSVDSRFGLPHTVQEVRSFCTSDRVEGALFAIVTPNADGATFDAEVVDRSGRRYVHLSGYGTVAMPGAIDAEPLKALQVAA
ncbi:MAG TPA: polyketide synthase dehydratase domain-containing protein, partial [Terriglobales bacterium]|nr:polyketide synthase dehydratase domain-containing protein [Terriglobales bacterium]